jgi:dTDP-4-dehydrorhamnose reductase
MRLSIIGASGFIGAHLALSFGDTASVYGTYYRNEAAKVPGCAYSQVDLLDLESIRQHFEIAQPDVVVLAAGTRDLAWCEKNPLQARQIHVGGTENILEACKKFSPYLIYLSTDCVFDGSRPFFSESDAVNPINQYGRVKLETERLIQANYPAALILRVSMTYGWVLQNQNSNTVFEVIRSLQGGETITLPTTLYNTPVYVSEIARCLKALVQEPRNGLLHLGGKDRVSRYELGIRSANAFGLDPALVLPASVHQGIRPLNSCLGVARLEEVLHRPAGSLAEGLAEMAREPLPVTHNTSAIPKRAL